jgi:DNA repair exonuclease SbcCD ATPase subunit
MINFLKLRYKNFLSSGNQFTEIDFTVSPTTLIVGHNGAGKSTMLDALSFGLFGKPHRKISKGQLVNSINQKGTEVEVEFSIGQMDYKVVRGIKPNKFEIWTNGSMINQNSHAKEYQSLLEKNILKLTHKSFHQIVVLGSSSFVPFMQLSGGARREVIEDLLDINIFSKMNGLLKEKMSILRDKIKDNGHDIEVVRTKINSQKKYLRDLSAMNSAHRTEKENAIEQLYSEIGQLSDFNAENMDSVVNELDMISKSLEVLNSKKQKILEFQSTFKTQAKSVAKEAKFFDEHDTCPTCEQSIPDELRDSKKSAATKRAKELTEALTMSKSEMEKYEKEINQLNDSYEKARDIQNVIQNNQGTISRLQKNVDTLKREIEELTDTHSQFAEANSELETLNKELEEKQDDKYKLNEQYSYNQVSSELLKDSGIKTKIIKQYIPVINQLTNKYLQILDFFVHFDLDENFSETIRSRHRDAFTYDSFSEGEKQRIDLSLLFTWRQVAKMKNSVATNLLILDETFDSSLDEEGVDNLMKILYTLGEDTNVFVISHKSELEDAAFSRKLEFVKDKNFSKIKA